MKCSRSRIVNPDGVKFGNECGSKLENTCPKCGKVNPPGSKFCNECGRKLATEEAIAREVTSLEGERKEITVLFSDLIG